MQTRHRRVHYALWWLIGPLLLFGVVTGLALRRPLPVQPALDAPTASANSTEVEQTVERAP